MGRWQRIARFPQVQNTGHENAHAALDDASFTLRLARRRDCRDAGPARPRGRQRIQEVTVYKKGSSAEFVGSLTHFPAAWLTVRGAV